MATRHIWSTLSGLALAAAVAAASPPDEALAHRLVEVMGADARLADGVHSDADRLFATGKISLKQRDCFQIDRSEFTEALERAAIRELSADEVQRAIAYFETSTGQKHLQIAELERTVGGNELDAATRALTVSEIDEMHRFSTTPEGIKLLTKQVLTNSAADHGQISGAIWWLKWKCNSMPRS